MADTDKRNGSRRIELFVPVEWNKAKFDYVEFRAVTHDDVIRWGEGDFETATKFMAYLADMPEQKLRAVTYAAGDMPRVWQAFIDQCPPAIRDDIIANVRRVKPPEEQAAVAESDEPTAAAANGGLPEEWPITQESPAESENLTGFSA